MRRPKPSLDSLRRQAVATSLFPQTTLRRAIDRLGFIQADPIRSPARAQDLILRHRVREYFVGDLDRKYASLDLDEDTLYAYGFVPQPTRELLHPREARELTPAEQAVLNVVAGRRRSHPRELEAHVASNREVNAWGGYSKSTTRVLDRLHHYGSIRVVGRENGVRVYGPARPPHEALNETERLRRLVLIVARILAPLPATSLRESLRHLAYAAPQLSGRTLVTKDLLAAGDLEAADVDGVQYVWPKGALSHSLPDATVRFLAPFDPLVWDRRRFEHFWGWRYRFEAYTPSAKRKLGYYAMPLLWDCDVVGWVNASARNDRLQIDAGFARGMPAGKAFRGAFDDECERMRRFLRLSDVAVSQKSMRTL